MGRNFVKLATCLAATTNSLLPTASVVSCFFPTQLPFYSPMKHSLFLLPLTLLLASCVDTTGLSEETSRPPKGNPQGTVVVQEFADLQCPSCKSAHETVNEPLLAQYGQQIRFEFRHFPLRAIHPYALDAAEAAECAADQGKFWEYVDTVYTNQAQLKNDALKEWAERLGMDMDLFDRCTRSNIKRDLIMADYEMGQDAGVTGTPTYFVAGKKTEATVEALGAAIQEAMAGTATRL